MSKPEKVPSPYMIDDTLGVFPMIVGNRAVNVPMKVPEGHRPVRVYDTADGTQATGITTVFVPVGQEDPPNAVPAPRVIYDE